MYGDMQVSSACTDAQAIEMNVTNSAAIAFFTMPPPDSQGAPMLNPNSAEMQETIRLLMSSLTSYYSTMAMIYSVYEAKARFSEVIRQVREGKTVTVSYRGEPVAEISPIARQAEPSLDQRLRDLERRGALIPSRANRQTLEPVVRRPGALARFLAERRE